jgi:hypothetical protein
MINSTAGRMMLPIALFMQTLIPLALRSQNTVSLVQPVLAPIDETSTTITGSCSQTGAPSEIVITKQATPPDAQIQMRTPCTNGAFSAQPGFPLQALMVFSAQQVAGAMQSPASAQVTVGAVPDRDEHCTTDPELSIHRAFVSPKNLADAFGRRIADRYLALQVTIGNENKDHQFLIHNITIGYRDLLRGWIEANEKGDVEGKLDAACGPKTDNVCKASSADLTMLRGVAEKGAAYDPRNFIIRSLEGLGAVGGGVTGLIGGPLFSKIVAVFSGPFVTSVSKVFPDFTVNQLNRLNDLAYVTNTVISKEQSRIVVVFLPQPLFLKNSEQKEFYNDAGAFLRTSQWTTFRRVSICVAGVHIAEVNSLAAKIDDIVVTSNPAEFAKDSPEIKGYLAGQFFPGGDLNISSPAGATITKDGSPSNSKYPFIIKSTQPIPPDSVITIDVVKPDSTANRSKTVTYRLPAPAISAISVSTIKPGDKDVALTVTGTNFVKGHTILAAGSGLKLVADDDQSSATKLVGKLTADADATAGDREVTVTVFDQTSKAKKITVAK